MELPVLDPKTVDFTTLRAIPPHDLAELLLEFTPAELAALFKRFGDERLAELVAELESRDAARLLLKLSRPEAADVLEEMPPDDAADVVEELAPVEADVILREMEPEEARELKALLAYPEGSAGSLMTPDYVAIRPDLTAREALAALQKVAEEVESVHYIYVSDPETGRLLGVLSLYRLTFARPDALVRDLMTREAVKVRADAPREEAARLLQRYDYISIPVVDADDRLVGIITVDDVMDVLQEEFSEDIMRLVGADAAAMAHRSPLQAARLRLPWLLGTMVIELGAGFVISRFDYVLTQVILLASFMPIISAVSGNVGLQAAAIVVRGLDTGHVRLRRWWAALRKEVVTTLTMAMITGLILGMVGAFWSRHLPFGMVIGGAMTASMLTAGIMGTIFPLLSKRLGFDPATTAGPFETAFQDVVGFAVFLWLASRLLQYIT